MLEITRNTHIKVKYEMLYNITNSKPGCIVWNKKMAKRLKVLSSLLFRTPLIKNHMIPVYVSYIYIYIFNIIKIFHNKPLRTIYLKPFCLKSFFCFYFVIQPLLTFYFGSFEQLKYMFIIDLQTCSFDRIIIWTWYLTFV